MVSASEQMIDPVRQRRRSRVLADGGEIGSHLAIEQRQLLQFAAGEPLQSALAGRGDQGGQPFPVWRAFFDPKIREDGLH